MAQYLSRIRNRSSKRTLACFILTLTSGLFGVGCTATKPEQKMPVSTNTQPPNNTTQVGNELATVDIAVIPWQVSAAQEEKLKPLADYLTQKLGQPVKFQITKDYETSVDLLVEGKVEFAYLGALTYLKAKQRDPQVQPIVAPIEKTTGRPWYTSIIVVNKASGIKSLKDLKGKRFAFVSQSSTSGYLVPSVEFKQRGINPDRDFAVVKYPGSHDKAKAALIAGEVDAIADDKRSYLTMQKAGKLDAAKYEIIWESQPIPNIPIVASSKVTPQLIARLKKAFVETPDGLIDPSGSESAGYTLVQDEDYATIRKLYQTINQQ